MRLKVALIGIELEDKHNKFERVIELIEEYSQTRFDEERIFSMALHGLSVLKQFPDSVSASLFLMNEDTFLFEHSTTVPPNIEYNTSELFDNLTESGKIGEALSTKDSNIFVEQEIVSVIIPLFNKVSPLGIIIARFLKTGFSLELYLQRFCNIFGALFSSSLENAQLLIQKENTKLELSQFVATRTIDLVQSKTKLMEKIEDLKSNLSMSIPHEVRTPINQILGSTDYLIKYFNNIDFAEASEIFYDVFSSAKRLKFLFENYLFYATLSLKATDIKEIEQMQSKITPSLSDIVFATVSYLSTEYNRSDDVSFGIIDFPLKIGEDLLRKVILEICDNSMKFTSKGTQIRIVSQRINDLCQIIVYDEGKGFTEDQIKGVDAYTQFDRWTNEQQGSGLGLSIVQRIVDIHSGVFSINSQINQFTEVKISLPIALEYLD